MARRILITGASTGIGAATARRLAAADTTIGIHYNSKRAEAEKVGAGIEALGARAIVLQGDLNRPEACERLVASFVEQAGGLDVLVNNAGSLVERRPVRELDWALIENVLRINLVSLIYVSRCALPHLEKGDAASIVNVGSIAGRHGAPTATVYGAAKAAVHCFTRGLAKEAAPKVRVNAVAPGVIETPFHEKFSNDEMMKKFAAGTPLARNGTAEEIAEAIAYLASPVSGGFITGETIDINGGLFMR
jgi:3-oxoacyl-[acyl-carrier protein] reductase